MKLPKKLDLHKGPDFVCFPIFGAKVHSYWGQGLLRSGTLLTELNLSPPFSFIYQNSTPPLEEEKEKCWQIYIYIISVDSREGKRSKTWIRAPCSCIPCHVWKFVWFLLSLFYSSHYSMTCVAWSLSMQSILQPPSLPILFSKSNHVKQDIINSAFKEQRWKK